MRAKEESEKAGLKVDIKKTKILWSGPITSWQTEQKKVEEVTDFLFLGSKITADGDCRHEIRRQLLLGRKAMTNLHNMLKSKEMTLLTKLWIVKAIVFPVVMYGCESWTLKKAECQKIYAFDLWCWWRLLRVPWKARSNQPISKEINPEYSLEGLMLKLKLQYFGHLMRTADSLKKTLMLGKTEDRRRRGWQRMRWHHWFNEHELGQTPRDGRDWKPGVLQPIKLQSVQYSLATEQQCESIPILQLLFFCFFEKCHWYFDRDCRVCVLLWVVQTS